MRPVLALLLAALLAPAAASGASLPRGIYDCNSSQESYINSVKIKDGGVYVWAAERKGRTLKLTTTGRYSVKGKRISWLSGTYKKGGYVSTIYSGYFSIDRKADGIWTGISCHRNTNLRSVASAAAGKKQPKPPSVALVTKQITDRYVTQNTDGDRLPVVTVEGVRFFKATTINPTGDTSAGAVKRVPAFAFRACAKVTPPGSSTTWTYGYCSDLKSYFFFFRDLAGKWTWLTGGKDLL